MEMVILTSNSENRMVLISLLCIILIIATISNALLLLVFHRRPGLRTISNRFVINLLVTNLITCWILLPLLLLNHSWRRTSIASETTDSSNNYYYIIQCAVFEGIAIGLCVACVLSVLMIGIDQYFAVIDPLRYHSSIKATTSVIMIVISWTTAISFGIFGGLTINRNCTWYVCEYMDNDPLTMLPKIYQTIFPIVFAMFVFVIPFTAICWIYSSICSAAHENNQRTRHGNGSLKSATQDSILDYNIVSTIHESVKCDSNDKKKLPELPVSKSLHHSSTRSSLKSTSSSIVNSLRHRFSNASMFRYREETRAARISALVIVMALFCWLPFTTLLLLRSPLLQNHLIIPSFVRQMVILSLCSSAVVSPLIFAHRNRRVHCELCKLFRLSKRSASFYDNLSVRERNLLLKKRLSSPKLRKKNLPLSIAASIGPREDCYFSPLRIPIDPIIKRPKKCVSMLNGVWYDMAAESERDHDELQLPEAALETDTSRSSFSSNASSGSNQGSMSAASMSECDVVVEEV